MKKKTKLITLRVSPDVLKQIDAMADQHEVGKPASRRRSAWIRHVATASPGWEIERAKLQRVLDALHDDVNALSAQLASIRDNL